MPLNDAYGQGVPYHVLDDAADAQTLGEGIVNGVVPQTIMRFNSAAHRGAVVSAPVAGMVAWLRDVRRLDVYDGSTWVAVATGTTAWTTVTPLVSPWVHNANENGNFRYRVINLAGERVMQLAGSVGRTSASYPSPNPGWYQLNQVPLPEMARPDSLRTVPCSTSDVESDRCTANLNLRTDGYFRVYSIGGAARRPPWVSFNGIYIPLAN